MFMKSIATAGALALFATAASAVTFLDATDSGGTFNLQSDAFQFQDTFAAGAAGPLTFTFENTAATAAVFVVSDVSVLQGGGSFFTGGADISWTGAGTVVSVGQGDNANGQLKFTLAGNSSDTLTLDFGAVVLGSFGISPDIDFTVSAVPVPAGALLLGTALVGFGAARRKQRKS